MAGCVRRIVPVVTVVVAFCACASAANAASAIQLVKSATLQLGPNSTLEAGDTILYGFVIQNIGNVTLTGVDLDDSLLGYTDVTCGQTTLAPGGSTNCQATYTLTQSDIDAGSASNTATACGTPPSGPDVCDGDSTLTPLAANKAIQLVKSATLQLGPNSTLEAGDTILYGFVIQNIGNVTLTGVDLDDSLLGYTDVTCGQTTLAPAASTNCQAIYTLTQSDIDAGSASNTATACGMPPSGPDVCDSDSTLTPLVSHAIQLTVMATLQLGANGTLDVGDTILYTAAVQNIGSEGLTGVDLDVPLLSLVDVTCGQSTLAAGQSSSCSATYAITQADIDAGAVAGTATACGTPPSGPDVCDSDSTSTPLVVTPPPPPAGDTTPVSGENTTPPPALAPTAAPPPPTPAEARQVLTVVTSTRLRRLLRSGAFDVPVVAGSPTQVRVELLRGKVRATSARMLVLARGTKLVSGSDRVKVLLTKAGRKLLRAGKVTAAVRITLTRGGKSATATRVVVLRPARR